jgi:GNAT superfamily N-acetyltransferase
LKYKKELLTETYCFEFKGLLAALISFRNDSLELTLRKRRKLLPNPKEVYSTLPAVKIARMGVIKDFQGNGIGSRLLNLCKKLFLTENRTGCRLLTVDAYNKNAVIKFYQKNGFQILHDKDKLDDSRTMWSDLKRIDVRD